jgi:hypothetical protein
MLDRYRGILVVLGAVGTVLIGSLLHLFRAPDGWLYDLTVQTGMWGNVTPPSVVIVETPPDEPSLSADGVDVLNYLHELGAKQVILLSAPDSVDEAFWAAARAYGNVVIGRATEPDAGTVAGAPQSPFDDDTTDKTNGVPLGAVALPAAESGVHRYAATHLIADGRKLMTLPTVVARRLGKDPPLGPFLVNFNQGLDWIPRVSMQRVLKRGLIADLVASRVVLIGPGRTAAEPGLHTPANPTGVGISLLAYQAQAIDTLLQDREIRTTPWAIKVLILGAIGLLNLVVFQWFHLDRSSWFTAGMVGIYLVVGWLLLHGLRVWLPVTEIALAQLIMFWLFVRLRLVSDDQKMRHAVLHRMARLHEYMLPPDFYRLDEHWAQVIRFVDQALNLNRIIFLEKVEGDHRVREVQALRCSLDDIDERRRDFEREPYKGAIAEGGPIRLDHRMFFVGGQDESFQQYLVPLLFAGEVQGFWAFDVDPQLIDLGENTLGNIRDFGNQIAELLYHRHRWLEQQDSDTGMLRRLLGLEAVKATSQEVNELLDLLDNRLQAVQAVFDGLTTASIQYDLFGRVVQLNSSMEQFMKRQGLPGFKLTALDLLREISGYSQQQARHLLQQVVVERREFFLPLHLRDDSGERGSVHIKPLAAGKHDNLAHGSTAPFELSGILFEVHWNQERDRQQETRDQLLEWTRLRLRSEFNALLEADEADERIAAAAGSDLRWHGGEAFTKTASRADSGNKSRGHGAHAAANDCDGEISTRMANVLATLQTVQDALATEGTDIAGGRPVDVYPILTSAIDGLRAFAEGKRVTFDVEIPRLLSLVRVCPEQLTLLFRSLLEVLLGDAASNSTLTVRAIEADGALSIQMDDVGFGIPDERLQGYMWQPGHETSEDFRALRQAVQPVADWGGEIQVNSEVGVGIWARLRLQVIT